MRFATLAVAWVLDLVLVAAAGAVLFVALAGGGEFLLANRRVSITTTGNPIILAGVLLILRYATAPDAPFLGVFRLTRAEIEGRSIRLLKRFAADPADGATSHRRAWRFVLILAAVSFTLRALNAWMHPGFVTGDDVEIHEMTFRALFNLDWPIWNVRSPIYPLSFIYPVQAFLVSLNIDRPEMLVFAGRLVVVTIATLTVVLTYIAALRLTRHLPTALLAAVLVATSRLHLWFGSTELPRPVATVFVLAAFLILLARGWWRAAMAGMLLGIGGALRFGELIFFAPAATHLFLERRRREAGILAVTGVATACAFLAVGDWLYWDSPLQSLGNIVDYTLVQRQSSRGFQPVTYYLVEAAGWSNYLIVALAIYGIRGPDRRAWIWGWLPIVLLSGLPHKEARYLIAAQPFICIAAALSFRELARQRAQTHRFAPLLLAGALLLAIAFEISSWRYEKTDDAVYLAQEIRLARPQGIAAEQLWRFGGRLYWRNVPVLTELAGHEIGTLEPAIRDPQIDWVIVIRDESAADAADVLESRGFSQAFAERTARYLVFRRDPP